MRRTESPMPENSLSAALRGSLGADLATLWGGLAESEPLTPESVARLAAASVPHSAATSVALRREGQRFTSIAASDELGTRVDELQSALGEGPCLDAARGPSVVLVEDLSTDP